MSQEKLLGILNMKFKGIKYKNTSKLEQFISFLEILQHKTIKIKSWPSPSEGHWP